MRTEIITDQFVDLDAFERTQKVKRVYVNDSGKLLIDDPIPAIAEADPYDIQMTYNLRCGR